LTNALIEGANFQGADLWGANLQGVVYDEERWWDFLCPERSRKGPSFGGDYQSPNYLNLRSGLHVIQYIAGENRRWSFGRKHPLLGWVWYMLANFGRSPTRLLFWVGVVWFLFAAIYASSALLNCVETSCLGDYLCCLDWLLPRIQWGNQAYPRHLVEPLYFSIVTLVGLGSEDIVPKSLIAQVYVALQGVLGYLMLAIFISVLLQDSGQTSGMPEQGRQPLFDDRDDRSNPSRHYGGPS
jgi:hypothetical protein